MLCQAPALDQPVNCNDEGISGPNVQPPSNGSSHTPLDEQHLEQQPTTRFFSSPSANQIAYLGGEYDSEYGFGTAFGDESEDPFADKSLEETLFWQRALFQDHFNIESLTPQQRGVVENNSFQGNDYVQMNDGSRMPK